MNQKAKKYLIIGISILVCGILDFLINTLFQDLFHAPLFFDTIFMIAILFVYGPFAAFLEYIVFIKLTCIKLTVIYGNNDFVYLYALSALTIILVTWLFIRKKENLNKGINFTFLYILTAAFCAGFACSIVSGFISYFTFDFNVKDWAFDKIVYAYEGEKLNFLTTAILGRIPVTFLDRAITTFAGFGIYKLFRKVCEK